MDFSIKKCVAWAGELQSEDDWRAFAEGKRKLTQSDVLPGLKQIPAMQRRRLSPFAKLALHCALGAAENCLDNTPSVFASRHGDLQKTSKLIENVAAKEELSPTQFGLSVHNAVGGLFSIYTGNKEPQTAISAGEDSFFIALVDAVSKLYSNKYEQILLVFTETRVPDIYQRYVAQEEVSMSVALLLEKPQQADQDFYLNMASNKGINESPKMQALEFLAFYYSNQHQLEVCSKRHLWTLKRSY